MLRLFRRRAPSVAVVTMVRDEAVWLPSWVEYYGTQLGVENLTVFDDISTDGSTDSLPCRVRRMSPGWAQGLRFDGRRMRLMNQTANRLLERVRRRDHADADEFLVPDPGRFDGLVDFLTARRGVPVIAPVGLNVIQSTLVGRRPRHHQARTPFDPELFMLHIEFADRELLRVAAARRHARFLAERSGRTSAWVKPPTTCYDGWRGSSTRWTRRPLPSSTPEA